MKKYYYCSKHRKILNIFYFSDPMLGIRDTLIWIILSYSLALLLLGTTTVLFLFYSAIKSRSLNYNILMYLFWNMHVNKFPKRIKKKKKNLPFTHFKKKFLKLIFMQYGYQTYQYKAKTDYKKLVTRLRLPFLLVLECPRNLWLKQIFFFLCFLWKLYLLNIS